MSTGPERHRARERALEILYEASIKGRPAGDVLAGANLRPDPYTVSVIESAEAYRARIDELIGACAIDWPLDRMALVDRLIMTLAIAELLLPEPPPTAVILDEAVELAKVFSTESSPSFVNGVLAAVVRRIHE